MRLRDQLVGVSASPHTSSGAGAGVAGPLVEEVAAEGHSVAHRAAEHVAHGPPGLVALEVEAGDLEGGVDRLDGGRHVEHPAEGRPGPAGLATQHVHDDPTHPGEVERVEAAERGRDRGQPREVGLVGVRLAEPEQAGVGVHLDDRAQRPRLVDADDVEQRRVGEGDRGDDDA